MSNAEISHLVSISFPDLICPFLIKRAAQKAIAKDIYVKRIINSQEYRIILRQSLFIGLTDGAHLDVFRRSNPSLSHEQILLSYDISKDKGKEIIENLKNDLIKIRGKEINDNESQFNDVFLIDDFSASGLSYIRKGSDGSYKGKIAKVLHDLYENEGNISGIINKKNLQVSVILYIATDQAKQHLETKVQEWLLEHDVQEKPNIFIVQQLPENIRVQESTDKEIFHLLPKYFDEYIVDEHFKVGKYDRPYLGYDECALPIIMPHNTPNNSLPILWLDPGKKYIGLFPRVSRHKEMTK